MATTSTASTEIKIVNISNLAKIESFINDSAYKELIENSENYNKRLCIEQRMRMPFLDSQTGIAQTHSALFMKKRQRMPGSIQGQIYSYPAGRWRKSRRQYLIHQHRPFRVIREPDPDSLQGLERSSISGAQDNDSKDSTHREEQPPKEWFYDEVNMHEIDAFEERELDSDFDYDDGNYKKKRRGRRPNPEGVTRRGRGRGRGRRKMLDGEREPRTTKRGGKASAAAHQTPSATATAASSSSAAAAAAGTSATATTTSATLAPSSPLSSTSASAAAVASVAATSKTSTADDSNTPSSVPTEQPAPDEDDRLRKTTAAGLERGKAVPSPYCDFCLGDSRENRKTSIPEDLVSCSDCGRSGHPTCLQFTPNMIISVRRYRWQCIECKYCSICGTSDNDDQLLFCDDCDRGYHMYCLSPPLIVPPEGSWSCNICHEEFHKPAAV